jgi:O-6-methylguanine DNA methyltransferase
MDGLWCIMGVPPYFLREGRLQDFGKAYIGGKKYMAIHRALTLLRKIPRGRVVAYKELARACKTSPRAIGSIMAHNRDPLSYPCYKVVSSRGELCGYSAPGGIARKKTLLEEEGVAFLGRRVDPRHFYLF